MKIILAASLMAAAIVGMSAQAQHSNWIERKQIDKVRKALQRYYTECGFYPEDLAKLFDLTANDKNCRSFGIKDAKRWPAPLQDIRENREAVERLNYTPFGYHDYELSMRVFWTRDN